MKIIFASNNAHKAEEVKFILNQFGCNLELTSAAEFLGRKIEIEENGHSYEENALKKAEAIFALTSLPVISDDSGLEVEYLQGAPGLISARFAGPDASDKLNREKLLDMMSGVSERDRKARFVCVICFKHVDGINFFKGSVEGKIIFNERGEHGFGYDPIFIPDGYDETFAELSNDIKNQISHRANALKEFSEFAKNIV